MGRLKAIPRAPPSPQRYGSDGIARSMNIGGFASIKSICLSTLLLVIITLLTTTAIYHIVNVGPKPSESDVDFCAPQGDSGHTSDIPEPPKILPGVETIQSPDDDPVTPLTTNLQGTTYLPGRKKMQEYMRPQPPPCFGTHDSPKWYQLDVGARILQISTIPKRVDAKDNDFSLS